MQESHIPGGKQKARKNANEARPEVSNEQLFEQARAGDAHAGDLLVQRLRDGLFRFAMQFAKAPEKADDLVQNAFMKLFQQEGVMTNVNGWLKTTVRNRGYNATRDRNRRAGLLQMNKEMAPMGNSGVESPEQEALNTERRERINEALGKLSESHAQIIRMRFFEDMTYAEIQEALGVQLGTVMSRLSRAKRALNNVLAGSDMDSRPNKQEAA